MKPETLFPRLLRGREAQANPERGRGLFEHPWCEFPQPPDVASFARHPKDHAVANTALPPFAGQRWHPTGCNK